MSWRNGKGNAAQSLKRTIQAQLVAQPAHPFPDRQPGANGSQSVVLMNVWQAEDSHHGIADELFGPPAQRGQLIGCGVEKPSEHLA